MTDEIDRLKAENDRLQAEVRVTRKERPELEQELARSQAQSKFGLTEEDAARLKGTPADILADAEYWSTRQAVPVTLDADPDPDPATVTTPDATQAARVLRPKPAAKGGMSWMDRYKAANPSERQAMDRDVQAGRVDPLRE